MTLPVHDFLSCFFTQHYFLKFKDHQPIYMQILVVKDTNSLQAQRCFAMPVAQQWFWGIQHAARVPLPPPYDHGHGCAPGTQTRFFASVVSRFAQRTLVGFETCKLATIIIPV
jgi:hypothetical protein